TSPCKIMKIKILYALCLILLVGFIYITDFVNPSGQDYFGMFVIGLLIVSLIVSSYYNIKKLKYTRKDK
ncbi:hypothetical protein, partial [Bacillus thuringiensis]|uniref:hypothetical protein n=1 Tax=Bacillus thuringiensis TaxID=1428 RepID=UPI001C3F5FD3